MAKKKTTKKSTKESNDLYQIINVGKKHPINYYIFAKQFIDSKNIKFQARGNAISTACRAIALFKTMENMDLEMVCDLKMAEIDGRWVPDMMITVKKK
jgi:DNA-binding protein